MFQQCCLLPSVVSIPNGVKTIGTGGVSISVAPSFNQWVCLNLSTCSSFIIDIFSSCCKLETVSIPNNATNVAADAFVACRMPSTQTLDQEKYQNTMIQIVS